MDLSGFFDSSPGLYATQTFVHSLIAGAVVEIAIRSWRIRDPFLKQRFLLAVIFFPVFSFLAYRLIEPGRASVHFRLGALFDSGRWVHLELLGIFPLGAGLLFVFSLTSLVFLFQEFVPIVRHALASRRPGGGAAGIREDGDSRLDDALEGIPAEKPEVVVLEEDDGVIFSTTGRNAAVFLSSGLMDLLDADQLRAALAHEIAHVTRSRRPLLTVVFLLRVVMFFNPVILVAFRRAVQEDEKICDEMAVSMTGDAKALARTLRRLYLESDEPDGGRGVSEDLERYSHRLNIESRIRRLEREDPPAPSGGWAVLLLTLAVVAAVNYFIV